MRYTREMSDEILIESASYISSKRASEITGYAQDYIGQLARAGHIDARRVGGLWYVLMSSLESYKSKREGKDIKVYNADKDSNQDTDAPIPLDGKEYISANRASKITGYNQDYVGQLARGGKIFARQIGNRWYVDQEAIMQHKNDKDALMAAVQTSSVGISGPGQINQDVEPVQVEYPPLLTYSSDISENLIPNLGGRTDRQDSQFSSGNENDTRQGAASYRSFESKLQIKPDIATSHAAVAQKKIMRPQSIATPQTFVYKPVRKPAIKQTRLLAGAGVAVMILLVIGISLTKASTFATNQATVMLLAAISPASDMLETMLSPDLIYLRKK